MIAVQRKEKAFDSAGVERFESTSPSAEHESAPALSSNPADACVPRLEDKLSGLDVSTSFLAELALKIASLDSDCNTRKMSERLKLGLFSTEALIERLYREKMIEKRGVVATHNYQYTLLERGWSEVKRLMDLCSYTGPAPVSLDSYSKKLKEQVSSRLPVTRESVDRAMQGLVFSDDAKDILALVAGSGRSLFLTGPPGNGKTATARCLVNAISGDLWIPHAIEVDGQVIRIYDAHNHRAVPHSDENYDHRWVRIRVPLVTVGGELHIRHLDLSHTDTQRFYDAPVQMKANGGVLLVDDLGRQRCSAEELLNRWIVPLEYKIDYLTLGTGTKIQVPFEQVVIFATNLSENDLADEAFLRRMGYRLHVGQPSAETYAQIFTNYAHSRGLYVDSSLIPKLFQRYQAEKRTPKCCDPRDLIERTIDLCKLRNQKADLTEDKLNSVWKGYFGSPQA